MVNGWSKEEIEYLVENYSTTPYEELCKVLSNRSKAGIYKKAYKMGLKKDEATQFLDRSNVRKGDKGANWKGGHRRTRKGYVQVLVPGHPRADRYGYVMEHIYVFEKETGIEVPKNCVVHHLNGIKNDNRIENLCLMSFGGHTVFHHKGTTRSSETKIKISESKRKGKTDEFSGNDGKAHERS